jgi:protein-tyrosine phosphatase
MRTSETHPIRIDPLPVGNGLLGLTFCPGKRGDSVYGAPWARDLETDLTAIRDWGAGLVVTLMERFEFDLLGVPDLPDRVIAADMGWTHLPIRDVDVPADPFDAVWPDVRTDLMSRLDAGERIVLHCRGGLGRTGLVAALLLIEHGVDPETAIGQVRKARPGAIETERQEAYVRAYRPITTEETRDGLV